MLHKTSPFERICFRQFAGFAEIDKLRNICQPTKPRHIRFYHFTNPSINGRMIVLSQCCNKWAENGINTLLTFNFVHNKVIKLAAVKREQLAAEAEMARLERRDRLPSGWHKLVRAARLAKVRAALKKHRDAKARAERLHREQVAAIKDKARRSRTDYLLYPMTARYAHIHNKWRPPWGEKKRK